jgi:hypothetical protein
MEGDENHDFSQWVDKTVARHGTWNDFKGLETSDFHAIIKRAGDDVSDSDVGQWLTMTTVIQIIKF